MYYDQLLALKDRLKVLYINVLNHSYLEDSDKKLLLVEIGKEYKRLKKDLFRLRGIVIHVQSLMMKQEILKK